MKRIILILMQSVLVFSYAFAQSQTGALIRIMVAPEKRDMVYKTGEKVTFTVAVYKFGHLVEGGTLHYEVGPEKMDPVMSSEVALKKGQATIEGGKMNMPGFLRCTVSYNENGETYTNSGTAAIDPHKIMPTTTLPSDFKDFWDTNLKKLSEVPLEPIFTLMPEKCTSETKVYHVSYNNIEGRMYGILTMPVQPGRYPAILHVPGAGIRPYGGALYGKNVISLEIGIHGIPVNLYESSLYNDLRNGALKNYNLIKLDDRDEYYYKRVYLGCVKAVDFLYSLPEFDGVNIGVMGGSQGGALSIVTAGLDKRVKFLASYYPALSDLTGYLHGRAGGWPHMFRDEKTNKKENIETSKYYDVVNFGKQITVPGFYSFGFNDNVCPPTSIYSVLNVIKAEKKISVYHDMAHWRYPEAYKEGEAWLFNNLGVME